MQKKEQAPLCITVIGASGDLARKKIYPALFSLDSQGLLPENTFFFGLSRTEYSDASFRQKLMENLTCRYVPEESCEAKMQSFLSRCFYQPGAYDETDSFLSLYQRMREQEDAVAGAMQANRMFYMAIPPFLFLKVARSIGDAGLVQCCENDGAGWSRVVIEKPFGKDRASSDALVEQMGQVFSEEQTYRIDHYLGKELIQNLMVLRFANRFFEPLWNCQHIEAVDITFKEDFGVTGRVGYFDQYGIIRDVMQNHLLQALALLAMEPPARYGAREIRDAKVEVLSCVETLQASDFRLGQYVAGKDQPGYKDDPDIPDDSITPTYAAVTMKVHNDRWEGVPFRISAGKALDERLTEIAIHFRPFEHSLFPGSLGGIQPNALIVRVQPDAGLFLRVNTKAPAQKLEIVQRDLNLLYKTAFDSVVPEAYESLLLDVIQGDKSLFIRADELEVAWDLFTPALHEMEQKGMQPRSYAFGTVDP